MTFKINKMPNSRYYCKAEKGTPTVNITESEYLKALEVIRLYRAQLIREKNDNELQKLIYCLTGKKININQ